MKSKFLDHFFGRLPIGILVLNPAYRLHYSNESYSKLLNVKGELASNAAHMELLELCRKNRNKASGTIRLVPNETDAILVFEVFTSEIRLDGNEESFLVYSLLPVNNRDKLHKTSLRESYIFDRMRIHLDNQIVKYNGKTVPFSATEFKLLAFFCRNEDRLLSKEQLIKEVWGRSAQNTRTVDMYVSRIRKRLQDAGCKKNYIRTLHGQGYVFLVNE